MSKLLEASPGSFIGRESKPSSSATSETSKRRERRRAGAVLIRTVGSFWACEHPWHQPLTSSSRETNSPQLGQMITWVIAERATRRFASCRRLRFLPAQRSEQYWLPGRAVSLQSAVAHGRGGSGSSSRAGEPRDVRVVRSVRLARGSRCR
jgi:hypothetical protein